MVHHLLILLFVISGKSSHAEMTVGGKPVQAVDESGVRNVKSAEALLKTAIGGMPDGSWKKGFQKYLEIVKPEAYASGEVEKANPGLVEYIHGHLSGHDRECLRAAHTRFYKDIAVTVKNSRKAFIAKHGKPANFKHFDEDSSRLDNASRPDLDDEAGKGQSENLEPGWLWNLALKHSKGDKNVALFLIGSCGHDDHANFATAEVLCPGRNSSTYLAKSLGADVDIPRSLKEKVRRVQGPGRSTPIAAKNYHIVAGAFNTCELIRAGVDADVAQRIEVLGSRTYRSLAVCRTARGITKKESSFAELYRSAKNMKAGEPVDVAKMREELLASAETMKCDYHTDMKKPMARMVCSFAKLRDENDSPRAMKDRMKYSFARADAAELYNRWYFGGGKTPEISIPFTSKTLLKSYDVPCTDIRKGGPLDLLKGSSTALGLWEKPWGWTTERYQNALNHLATWELDFEWTQAQHEVGAAFAKKQCQKEDPHRSYEKLCDGTEKDESEAGGPDNKDEDEEEVEDSPATK